MKAIVAVGIIGIALFVGFAIWGVLDARESRSQRYEASIEAMQQQTQYVQHYFRRTSRMESWLNVAASHGYTVESMVQDPLSGSFTVIVVVED